MGVAKAVTSTSNLLQTQAQVHKQIQSCNLPTTV